MDREIVIGVTKERLKQLVESKELEKITEENPSVTITDLKTAEELFYADFYD